MGPSGSAVELFVGAGTEAETGWGIKRSGTDWSGSCNSGEMWADLSYVLG